LDYLKKISTGEEVLKFVANPITIKLGKAAEVLYHLYIPIFENLKGNSDKEFSKARLIGKLISD